MRLLFLARCVDLAAFVTGWAYVIWFGWPVTIIGWMTLLGCWLPTLSWWAWTAIRPFLDARAARQTMAYRREKFGGFISTPLPDGKGQTLVQPVERPRR